MKKILFISWAGPGHWNPLLGVAEQVLALGHEVHWICITAVGGSAAVQHELGGRNFSVSILEHHPELAQMPHTDDHTDYVAWSHRVHFENMPQRVRRVREIIAAVRPDAIGVSGLVYDGVIASHLEGIPYACLSTELTPLLPAGIDYEELAVARQLAPIRDRIFDQFGLMPRFRCNEYLSPFFTAVFTTDAFVGRNLNRPARIRLVGPSLASSSRFGEGSFPWERLSETKPIIYAAVGSQLSLIAGEVRMMSGAAEMLGAQLVVATGAPVDLSVAGIPTDTITVASAPQRALLKRASACITHGGANSVMEALSHGVPLLAVPVRYDQPLNAHFVVRAGVGASLSRESVSRDAYAALLDTLLHSQDIRSRIREVSASYQAHRGAQATAQDLISLA